MVIANNGVKSQVRQQWHITICTCRAVNDSCTYVSSRYIFVIASLPYGLPICHCTCHSVQMFSFLFVFLLLLLILLLMYPRSNKYSHYVQSHNDLANCSLAALVVSVNKAVLLHCHLLGLLFSLPLLSSLFLWLCGNIK